jgi:integrase
MNYNTKFKQDLINKFKEKNISETSVNLYIRNLEKLNDDEPIKNLKFLSNIEGIIDKLKNYKPNTYRGYLISICSALNVDNSKNMKKIYQSYYDLLIKINKTLKEKESQQDKTEAQKENWITWDDVKNKLEELKKKVDEFKNNKEINYHKYNTLLEYVILSCYYYISPKRNQDWTLMMIVSKLDNTLPVTNNYLVYSDKKFVFNKYKTSKTNGELIEDIPDELFKIIEIYLNFHPLLKNKKIIKNTNVPFLVYDDGKSLSSINSITRILNKIFNKKIGSSMLRHIYLTSKYSNTVKEMKKDAEIMGHSVDTAINNYIKK